jgi:hypothetical protein
MANDERERWERCAEVLSLTLRHESLRRVRGSRKRVEIFDPHFVIANHREVRIGVAIRDRILALADKLAQVERTLWNAEWLASHWARGLWSTPQALEPTKRLYCEHAAEVIAAALAETAPRTDG